MIRFALFLFLIAEGLGNAQAVEGVNGSYGPTLLIGSVIAFIGVVSLFLVFLKNKETNSHTESKNTLEKKAQFVQHQESAREKKEESVPSFDLDEVDPVAEADVYMAYGRDVQAEEILKEALGKSPENNRVKLKLLELYVARKDRESFEGIFESLRGGDSDIWESAVRLSRSPGFGLDFGPIEVTSPSVPVAIESIVPDTSLDGARRCESTRIISGVLSDIKRLVDSGDVKTVNVGVQENKELESGSKYVITIELR